VSLWYQAPQNTFEPRDSRSIGWSQVPNRKAVLLDDEFQSPQHSTGGGTQIDLSNTMSFGGPKINNSVSVSVGGAGGMGIQLDPTINFAQFGFQNVQDMTFEQYQMISNQSFSEVLNQIENIYTILDSANYEARIAALESWYANASAACNGNKDYITSVSLGAGGLVFTKDRLTFTQGLLSGCGTSVGTTTITTTTCP
jgi:hypothetical protein